MAPLTGRDFHDPTLTGPRASTKIPSGGLFSAYSSAKINAPPQVVYDALLDVAEWKEWNEFVPNVTITKTPNVHGKEAGSHKRLTGGTCMIFHRNFGKEEPGQGRHVVTLVEKLKLSSDGHSSPCITRIRWQLDNAAISTPGFLLKSEQINEIEEAHDGTTIYRTWQSFAGPVAKMLRKKLEPVWKSGLQEWSRDLKKWCEGKQAQGGAESVKPDPAKLVGRSEGGQTEYPPKPVG